MSVPAENGLIATILPEVCYPNVDANSGLAPSPVSEFLADEEAASTCPLLTPSPPTEFQHPLSTAGKDSPLIYIRYFSVLKNNTETQQLYYYRKLY